MILDGGFSKNREFSIAFSPSNLPTENLRVSISQFISRARNLVYQGKLDEYDYLSRDLRLGVYVTDPNFVDVVDAEPFSMAKNQVNFSLKLKNLNSLPVGGKKYIMIAIAFYDFVKDPTDDKIFTRVLLDYKLGSIFLYNRGSNPENPEAEREYESDITYYGLGKEIRNNFKSKLGSQAFSYAKFLNEWNSNLNNGTLTPIKVIPDDLLSYWVISSGEKYYLKINTATNTDYLEPREFWKKTNDRYFYAEITENGNYIVAFPNANFKYSLTVDSVGSQIIQEIRKSPKFLEGDYSPESERRPPLEQNPELQPLDPTSPIFPADPKKEPIDPTNPLAPMNPPKPAPEPSTPVMPAPKPNPKMPLVTNENQKKKPYDPTFLIVSGLFATAIIFGE